MLLATNIVLLTCHMGLLKEARELHRGSSTEVFSLIDRPPQGPDLCLSIIVRYLTPVLLNKKLAISVVFGQRRVCTHTQSGVPPEPGIASSQDSASRNFVILRLYLIVCDWKGKRPCFTTQDRDSQGVSGYFSWNLCALLRRDKSRRGLQTRGP